MKNLFAIILPALILTRAWGDVLINNLHDFDANKSGTNADGSQVCSPLVLADDGYLYGTAEYGGTNGSGTAFRYGPQGGFKLLHTFSGTPQRTNTDGAYPYGGLVDGGDGFLYGTTASGGTYGYGTVFKMTTNGAITLLHSFNYQDGENPLAGLVRAGGGYFYGTAALGGSNYSGCIFSIKTNGDFQQLFGFAPAGFLSGVGDTNANGAEPNGALAYYNGNLYGTAEQGGINGFGTVFRFTPANGNFAVLHTFSAPTNGTNSDGGNPYGGIMVANNGTLWGMATWLGALKYGTIYQITTGGVFSAVRSFDATPDGYAPQSCLVQGPDGFLYGTAPDGGSQYGGTLFRIGAAAPYTVLHNFSPNGSTGADGSFPCAGLCFGADGNLYGTTWSGGAHTNGVLFQVNLNPAKLAITSLTGHKTVVSWPTNQTGFTLQSTTNIVSTQWQTVSPLPSVLKDQYVVTNNATAVKTFYRLTK